MLYVVQADEQLFNKSRELETVYNTGLLLTSMVQNDMIIPTEYLNDMFNQIHEQLLELHKVFLPDHLKPLTILRDAIHTHILLCTQKATLESIKHMVDCDSRLAEQGYEAVMRQIQETQNHILKQRQS